MSCFVCKSVNFGAQLNIHYSSVPLPPARAIPDLLEAICTAEQSPGTELRDRALCKCKECRSIRSALNQLNDLSLGVLPDVELLQQRGQSRPVTPPQAHQTRGATKRWVKSIQSAVAAETKARMDTIELQRSKGSRYFSAARTYLGNNAAVRA